MNGRMDFYMDSVNEEMVDAYNCYHNDLSRLILPNQFGYYV